MLKLEKLTISGFKSFSDRTEVVFPDGITAIVGPNGCGKSNIGDAINWVLGEQSAKNLRGRQMLDVIFGGSAARKPQGMAEVTLHFLGAAGMSQANHDRIDITRRLFRSGDSEYLVNGAKARLKDIQEILRESHIGTRTYSKIEQGRIDQVLNAKPKERRQMIEDAAGISGYKHKRRLTELKLEATEANLLRVNDVIGEVTRQINSLKRQAAKARRYKNLREELREKDRLRYASRSLQVEAHLTELAAKEAEARDAEVEAAAGLGRLEVELTELRQRLETDRVAFRESTARLHELDKEVDREEAAIATLRERIEESDQAAQQHEAEAAGLVERVEALEAELRTQAEHVEAGAAELQTLDQRAGDEAAQVEEQRAALERRRAELEQARRDHLAALQQAAEQRNQLRLAEETLERDRQQQARVAAERESAESDWSRLEDDATRLAAAAESAVREAELAEQTWNQLREQAATRREERQRCIERLAEARETEQSALARLATLEDVMTRFAGASDGVRTLLASGSHLGVRTRGVVADFIQASSSIEQAAEGYLSGLLPTVVLEDDADVCRAASMLREQGAGRTTILSPKQPAGALAVGSTPNGSGPVPDSVLADPRVRGRLREQLQVNTALNGTLENRIGDAVLVDDLESALELHHRFPATDYLTADGDVVYASGLVVVAGEENGDRGLLAHNRRIQETRDALDVARRTTEELTQQRSELERAVAELEAREHDARERLEQARNRRLEMKMQAERSDEERTKSGRRRDVLGNELELLAERIARTNEEHERLNGAVQTAEAREGELEAALAEHGRGIDEADAEHRRRAQQLSALQADVAARHQRQEAAERDRDRTGEAAREIQQRREDLTSRAESARRRAVEAREQLEATESSLASHLEEREQGAKKLAETERSLEAMQRDVDQQDNALRGQRGELESLREATRDAELLRARAEADRQHLEQRCQEELECNTASVRESVGEQAEDLDLEALEAECNHIRGKIERLGPVNMTAIEEFSDLEQRHGFLTTQKEDLETSMTSLRETIRRINRQSRDRFVEAFDEIRTNYKKIYEALFNGGRADLRLEEGEDVLECGIEILAQPPGKRLSGVHLLSGGEKAMSAIALLFAIFRYQPSPFCMLDEVDAALDDANVGRFAKMLRDYAGSTQFIVVTHNKLSMEQADLLYGVTMEEPGVSRLVSMQMV